MPDEPVSEFQANDETLYRFDRDDLVLQLLDGVVIGTYRWRRALDFAIDEDVQVDFDGTVYEYVDEDTEVARAWHGAARHRCGVPSGLVRPRPGGASVPGSHNVD